MNDQRLDDLVLARIATTRKPSTIGALARSLRPYAPPTFDDARWALAIDGAVARLMATADLDEQRRVGAAPAAVAARFGASIPLVWKRLVERVVPGLALGIPAGDAKAHGRLTDRDTWSAAVVARALGHWRTGSPPTLAALCDEVVWRAIGLNGTPKRTPPEIRAHFVGRLPGAVAGPADRVVRLLAATNVGAPRADLRALREALVRRWLAGHEWRAGDDFAAAVRTAAERTSDGVFGGRKVFIRDVWKTLRGDPAFGDLTLDDFKRRLLGAHKAGTVSLVRADLVAAMDPEAVRESETAHLEARYHFIERNPS